MPCHSALSNGFKFNEHIVITVLEVNIAEKFKNYSMVTVRSAEIVFEIIIFYRSPFDILKWSLLI